jgi:ferredoxin
MARQLEVTVESTCISSGYCRNHAPDVFGTGPARKSVVLQNPVADSPKVQEAMESCPVEAISAVDADTGEDVFP